MKNALLFTGNADMEETARFVGYFDRFFDCMNVSSFTAGQHSRKPFKSPYRSATDFRLKVSINI